MPFVRKARLSSRPRNFTSPSKLKSWYLKSLQQPQTKPKIPFIQHLAIALSIESQGLVVVSSNTSTSLMLVIRVGGAMIDREVVAPGAMKDKYTRRVILGWEVLGAVKRRIRVTGPRVSRPYSTRSDLKRARND